VKGPSIKKTRTMIGVMVLSDMLDLMISDAVDAGLMVHLNKISRVYSSVEFRNRKTGEIVAIVPPRGSDRLYAARAVAAHMVERLDKEIAKVKPSALRKGHRL
jgi:hypothetical protein